MLTRSAENSASHLPQQITTFVGRERELAEIHRLLEGHRIVTLTGSGGTGKTRLALEVARQRIDRYPDGVWFIDLSSIADPAVVAQVFALSLNVLEEAGKPLIESIVNQFRNRDALLIVDNTEHLVDAAAGISKAILDECPLVQLLTTGRTVLDIETERTYRVPSMAAPDPRVNYTPRKLEEFEAVRLFIDRASKSDSSFQVSRENTQVLARVCHQIDGIPLAIELAAARVGTMSIQSVADKIEERFSQHASHLGLMPRQQTLRAMIAWSYDLLSENEQRLLRRLSVFSNGWSRESAEKICGEPEGYGGLGPAEVAMGLEDLVDKALVQFDDSQSRYRLLETVRSYARDALDETLEADSIRDKHLQYFADLTRAAEPHINGPDAKAFLATLDQEHENLRTAVEWGSKDGDPREALALACSLSTYYQVRGLFEEGLAAYSGLIAKVPGEPDLLIAEAMSAQGVLLFRQGQYGMTRQQVGTALEIYEKLGDVQGTAKTLNTLAVVALQLSEYDVAGPLFQRALKLFKEMGEERRVAMTLNNLGILAVHEKRIDEAERLYSEALEVNRRSGNRRFEAGNLTNLADVALRQGNPSKARDLARKACNLHLELGDRQNLQDTFEALAPAELKCGRPYVAALLFSNKEALMTELGTVIAPFVAEEYRKNVEEVRQALGEETFRAAFVEGRSMSPEDVFRASLEDF